MAVTDTLKRDSQLRKGLLSNKKNPLLHTKIKSFQRKSKF